MKQSLPRHQKERGEINNDKTKKNFNRRAILEWSVEKPPRGFGERGNKAIYFRGTRGQKSKTEGNRGTKEFWGTGNTENQECDFGEQRENADFFLGNKITGTPPGRASPLWGFNQFYLWVIIRITSESLESPCWGNYSVLYFLCWGFKAQSTRWDVECSQFTQPHFYWTGLVLWVITCQFPPKCQHKVLTYLFLTWLYSIKICHIKVIWSLSAKLHVSVV